MKRGLAAGAILLALALVLYVGAGLLCTATDALQAQLQAALAQSSAGDYEAADAHYRQAAADYGKRERWLALYVKRSYLSELSLRLAGLPAMNSPETQNELLQYTQELEAMLTNMKLSFFALF